MTRFFHYNIIGIGLIPKGVHLMSILHDNEIVKYEVDLRGEMIILYTRNDKTNIKVTYSGVLVHFFENVLSGSIIFDIEKYEIDLFLKRNVELLERQLLAHSL